MSAKLGETLLRENLITPQQLKEALEHQRTNGGRLGSTLVKLGMLSDEEVTAVLSRQYGVPSVNLELFEVDETAIKLISQETAKKYMVLPLSRVGPTLTLAMVDPTNVLAIDDIKFMTGLQVEPVIVSEQALSDSIERYYGMSRELEIATFIDEMQRNYESDLIQVERLRRTLRSWRIDEQELEEVEAEAQRLHELSLRAPGADSAETSGEARNEASWADVEVRSPLTGVVLERNLTVGDIVSTSDDLFKLADLSMLVAMVNVYEEDLPSLVALAENERKWELRFTSRPSGSAVPGSIEIIGNTIDPNQHTAIVQGWVDNASGELRMGQFVEATVRLPQSEGVIEIPSSGIVDEGARKYVFVAEDPELTRLKRREVTLVRRTANSSFVMSDALRGIHPGDRVIVQGVIELAAVLDALRPPSRK